MHVSEFPFTNHRITLAVYSNHNASEKSNSTQRWFPIRNLGSLPLPTPHRRALNQLLTTAGQIAS
jgi:hypothetical protein